MCRFVLYMGPAMTMDQLVTLPAHSIIRQSFKSRLRDEPLNGDGFGVAWYVPAIGPEPALFRSLAPAWSNQNLRHLARVTASPVILAHVRAASEGMEVADANCHPFVSGPFAFMHNGFIPGFASLKRRLQERLSDAAFADIRGTTDSEHVFALFLDRHREVSGDPDDALGDALAAAIVEVAELADGDATPCFLNVAVSDGKRAAVARFASKGGMPPSLFVNSGRAVVCRHGELQVVRPEADGPAVIVASEPLNDGPGWSEVPPGEMILLGTDRSIRYRSVLG